MAPTLLLSMNSMNFSQWQCLVLPIWQSAPIPQIFMDQALCGILGGKRSADNVSQIPKDWSWQGWKEEETREIPCKDLPCSPPNFPSHTSYIRFLVGNLAGKMLTWCWIFRFPVSNSSLSMSLTPLVHLPIHVDLSLPWAELSLNLNW